MSYDDAIAELEEQIKQQAAVIEQMREALQAMISAAVPKPAQAEKQEPVKDEPDFFVVVDETGAPEFTALWPEFCHEHINRAINEFDIEGAAKWKVVPLYTHPQPDLTTEVERLKAERDSFYMDYRMKCDLETKQQAERIAEIETEVERLHQIARDAYEVWAGSNGIPEPITCAEAYLLQLLIAMRDEVKRGLK